MNQPRKLASLTTDAESIGDIPWIVSGAFLG